MAFVPLRGLSGLADIAKAIALAEKSIGKAPGVGIVLPQDALDKLRWLQNGGRDFRLVNDLLLSRMGRAFTDALVKVMAGKAPITAPWQAAGDAYKAVLVQRLSTSGGDVTMKPLAATTIAAKGSSQIGRDTGTLFREVKAATVRLTR